MKPSPNSNSLISLYVGRSPIVYPIQCILGFLYLVHKPPSGWDLGHQEKSHVRTSSQFCLRVLFPFFSYIFTTYLWFSNFARAFYCNIMELPVKVTHVKQTLTTSINLVEISFLSAGFAAIRCEIHFYLDNQWYSERQLRIMWRFCSFRRSQNTLTVQILQPSLISVTFSNFVSGFLLFIQLQTSLVHSIWNPLALRSYTLNYDYQWKF